MSFFYFWNHTHIPPTPRITMALLLVPQTNTLFWKPPGILPCGHIVKREGDAEKRKRRKGHSLNLCLH